MSTCCPPPPPPKASSPTSDSCCTPPPRKADWLLWGATSIVSLTYVLALLPTDMVTVDWLATLSTAVFTLINTMWWGMLLAIIFVGLLGQIPQSFIIAILGKGGSWQGLWRATAAGVLLDLCSHGILMVGMQLYQRGASLGQVMAFLIASPWNSLSLTVIMVALIGLKWTLLFVALSILVALLSGRMFDLLVKTGRLPANPNRIEINPNFRFWTEARARIAATRLTPTLAGHILLGGLRDSRMVMRWLLFGVVLAALIRTFVEVGAFQTWFGPTLAGLGLTLLAATVIEVCSEGSTPIAADLLTRARAPGNSFVFLMAGVSTDYTEVMSLRDTTQSWKIALFLPLLTLPQILLLGWLLNQTVTTL